ncbi:MAG TPA: Asp-tRNA(Asn)/Glu-tRNA(Gln) amidotransferase subunit GatA [Flavitalea sp.]|nr:Asp-tRNA(Asn)/Glu-tRNA(Gln) amidotransferase subunit GatA [Flavitalea sp.]
MFPYSSINEYHDALHRGEVTCVQAVQYYLEQIHKNAHLNAFVHVFEQESLDRAKELDHHFSTVHTNGKLFGVVIAIKDVITIQGQPVSASSRILTGFLSVFNATVIDRILKEGAIIIGTTNCDEFAMGSSNENSIYGNVLNAIDNDRVAGGSSGGSAVAVQAGLSMISLGSDTGGSVRQPADFCGIVGLKPSYGRVSRYGLIAYASSFDQIGIFATNIPDTALILEVISGEDGLDSTVASEPVESYSSQLESPPNGKKKIGYLREALESESLDPEIAASIKTTIQRLRDDGYDVQPIDFGLLDFIVPTYYILTTAEASSNLSRFDGIRYGFRNVDNGGDLTSLYKKTRSEGFGKEVKRRIMLGTFVLSAGYYDAYFTRAQQVRRLLVDKMNLIFSDFSAVILPTVPSTAFKIGEKTDDPIEMYLADIFTVFANLTGIPAISLPLFWHSNGLPYGLQVMTKRFSELYLLQLSNTWLQHYRPPISEKPQTSTTRVSQML